MQDEATPYLTLVATFGVIFILSFFLPACRTSAGREEKLVITASQRWANLCVRKKERVPLPTLSDPTGMPQHLSVFLQQPAGTQSMLNTKALQKCEYLGDDVFRCYLPKLTLLNFEVAPIVDLFVAASDIDCQVEMRSCMVGFSNLPHLIWTLAFGIWSCWVQQTVQICLLYQFSTIMI